VGDQTPALADQTQGQIALADARRTLDQDAAPSGGRMTRHGGGVQRLHRLGQGRRPGRGRSTAKRAATTRPSPSTRFSAWTRPPWASTIWRTMDRPRPELAPKAVPLGREV